MKFPFVCNARNRPRCQGYIALGLLVSSLVAGCVGTSPQTTVAHKIADALPRWIGPAKHYNVQVEGDTFALARGRVRRVQIDGSNVQLSSNVSMDRINIDAHDVSFDRKARIIHRIADVSFIGQVDQGDIDRYLTKARPDLRDVTVRLRADDVQVSTPVTVRGYTTTVSVSGTLKPNADAANKLDFVANGGSIGIVPVPARLVNVAIDEINPLLDLSRLRFPITVKDVDIHNGTAAVHGTAIITEQRF